MRRRAPAATRVPVRLEPLVAVWAVPLTSKPCIRQQERPCETQEAHADVRTAIEYPTRGSGTRAVFPLRHLGTR
jgi:hypothetical protein